MPKESEPKEDRGFRVIDRRQEGRDEPETPPSEQKAKEPEPTKEQPQPESTAGAQAPSEQSEREGEAPQGPPVEGATQAPFKGDEAFGQFIISLATSAYMHLGLVPGPDGKPSETNLPLAQQTIDILGMLETKTQGNRTAQENALMDQLLSELRMRYVEVKKQS